MDIECIPHLWIPLPDGTRLAARLWRPRDAQRAPVPALVEYLPYRKSDGTAVTDPVRHAWFARHGYASLRVDLRGSGDSDGLLHDEYDAQELQDGVDLIAWIAAQPWCSGRVGAFGISWGGFNALQIAARRPPALRAIVSACSTDDRYADDVHYMGGTVLAYDTLAWATQFTVLQARAPSARVRPDDHRAEWLRRIDAMPHFAARWLAHPRRDDYWRHGSVCEDYGAIACPTMLVGGWADGYKNTIPRLLRGLRVPKRALLGPWSHGWPNAVRPGPTIAFGRACVRWFDRWLKDDDNGVEREPEVLAFEQVWQTPGEIARVRNGRWLALPAWPEHGEAAVLRLADSGLRTGAPEAHAARAIPNDLGHGIDGGMWCPFGARGDLPLDQREENARALVYTGDALAHDLGLFGAARLRVRLRADHASAQLVVRVCDIEPDGAALLVTRGVRDLTAHDDFAAATPLAQGDTFERTITLDAAAHRFAKGHRIALALGTSYWPMVWPCAQPVHVAVLGGELELPTTPADARAFAADALGAADGDAPLAIDVLEPASGERERRVVDGVALFTQHSSGPMIRLEDGGCVGQASEDRCAVPLHDAVAARVHCVREYMQGDDASRTRVRVEAEMRCTTDDFVLSQRITAYENDVLVAERRHDARVPRGDAQGSRT